MINSKKELRKNMVLKRDSLEPDLKSIKDNMIYNKVINSIQYKSANNIFVFVSYKSEVDTHNIIRTAIADGKKVFVPKVISKEKGMEAAEIRGFFDLEKSAYGILEPKSSNYIEPESIELLLVPGLAFDESGGRIGYGGGFYDRYMSLLDKSAVKVGICYDFQVIDKVIMNINDVPVDKIIVG
ncbi:5-formyltetrahydrofolate cyclo-ligase [Clostridium acetobutylicum]|uniref:5-formyltetrahydrofolate cyclo-ligase n=2 Tax=Clostridium acetobutylicum TaxID=1488 RepID=Q97K31_CLOAB|nr:MULTISPECIES: 5-formyltetrahydrofolate cyclo-ligase [Clostridium]AAK79064.1 5-formyltetrahydrofolate cyclo-ligase [Clostridium acetobutylicum ATCC 824]ADZ20139.1 5-formyltetrahydrofolate cyclo-ligase [Clostridium acetobutylicum EA 2018]AEI31610.1 5-formyltetrahydrofolate cyclo-ligase [Clostridium acetobutylicum DSM 1731]AWV81681.1 5-formyltetrahydrofolate cyclo-ligase [Clostridium acetobutylicum]MBC2395220.1 5-formyltetrahydrofolate cyclo-ligase [Clostridium acetobutylicum]